MSAVGATPIVETHYLNSDFDLSLRPRPRQLERPRLLRQVRELTTQALLGARAGDSALLRVEVPQSFLEHLAECGMPIPTPLRHPAIDPGTRLRPFGWSAEAIELNRRHHRPAEHPALSCVQRVNSKSFALELESELDPGRKTGTVVESPAALCAFLSRAPISSEWVIKAEHGNAGLANRRLREAALSPADRRFVEERLAEDDRLIVEPWLPREQDGCVVFSVPFDPGAFRFHETVCTRDGALIGALFEPAGGVFDRWQDDLGRMAERVAARLEGEGYRGPACVDVFTWRDGNRSRLRTLVDLNCRRSMSDGVHRLWRNSFGERVLYYRFFNRDKLSMPGDLAQALAGLGEQRYDRASRRGILLASPLRVGIENSFRAPGKLAVAFVADDRSGVFELEAWFRRRFEG